MIVNLVLLDIQFLEQLKVPFTGNYNPFLGVYKFTGSTLAKNAPFSWQAAAVLRSSGHTHRDPAQGNFQTGRLGAVLGGLPLKMPQRLHLAQNASESELDS